MKNKLTEKKYILFMLSRREYSRKELYQKMIEKEYFTKENIEKNLDWAEEFGYLSDERFTESNINYKLKNKGNNKIKYLLKNKGVSEDIIDKVLSETVSEENRAIHTLLKYKNSKIKEKVIDEKIKEKAIRFMASRGFNYNHIKEAWDIIFNEDFDEEEFNYKYDLNSFD